MTKPNKSRPYRIFRPTPHTAAIVLQVCCPESGEPVELADLDAYIVNKKLHSPWFQVSLPPGSRLLLTASAARFMVAAGTIRKLDEPTLILTRDRIADGGSPTLSAATAPTRKAGAVASHAG